MNLCPVFHLITTIERGGAEKQLLILVKSQIQSGRIVFIGYLKGRPELEEEFNSIGATVVPMCSFFGVIGQIFHLRKYLVSNQIRLVHAHLPRAELIACFTPAKFRFIVTRHNVESFFPQFPGNLSSISSRMVLSRSHHLVVISQAIKSFLIQNRETLSFKPISVVHYGYEANLQHRNLDEKNNLRDLPNAIVIGTIARLTEQKDIPTLLAAFAILRKKVDANLIVIGDGHLRKNLERLAATLGIEESVDWVGRVSDVNAQLDRFDYFVLTSLYEGFGLVLLEAMNSGVPIVACRNSAITEVMGEQYPGLVPTGDVHGFADKLAEFIEDRPSFEGYFESRLQYFNVVRMREQLDLIYS